MDSFKLFVENTDFVEFVLNEFNGAHSQTPSVQPAQQKTWSAKKAEILQLWRTLKPDTPILIQPITEKPEGSNKTNYGEDGIRITGSFSFISSVLGRLKEIISYENPETKLRLVFRGIDKSKQVRPDRQSFAFYVNLETRGKGRPGPRSNTKINFASQLPVPKI
jgi:hypothetical protein